MGLDRVVVQPRVGEELVDGFDVADLREVIFGLAGDIGLFGDALQRLAQVGCDQLVARIGRGHDRSPLAE
ncbi:hypothetical protein D3C71_1554600 [compost metagenome]